MSQEDTAFSNAIIDGMEFVGNEGLPQKWHKQVVQYCSFSSMEIYGSIDGILIGTTFEKVDFYWMLFNCTLVSRCTFTDCGFQGASFSGSRFVDCEFVNCRFELDNLGGQCSFSDSVFVECSFARSKFVPRTDKPEPMFEKTRFYGCSQDGCLGLTAF